MFKTGSILAHTGTLLAIICAILGSFAMQKVQMKVFEGGSESLAGELTLELRDFRAEFYDSGAPRHFASDISVTARDGSIVDGTVEVNKPLVANGWWIYQYGYDTGRGADSAFSEFLLVKDPWLTGVYSGFLLMLAGFWLLALGRFRGRELLSFGLLILAALLVYFFFRKSLGARQLVPALQSPWYAPHVVAYMFSFALLAIATVLAMFREKMEIADSLVYAGLAFFTTGMLLGAIWAKEAWGSYWTWDPKETWSAVAWAAYVLYLYLRKFRPGQRHIARILLGIALILIQICWWGIDYLPAAMNSLHVY